LEEETLVLLEQIGMDCSQTKNKGRKLILRIGKVGETAESLMQEEGEIHLILAKAADILTYVEHGACEMGIVGKDTIMESAQSLYEVLDLGFGRCRMMLASGKGKDFYQGYGVKTVATKYPNIARAFFEAKAMDVNIVRIEGSVELAPLLGLADGIVDIVETGGTLKANGLEEKELIAHLSARLVVNVAAMKLRKEEIDTFIRCLRQALLDEEAIRGEKK